MTHEERCEAYWRQNHGENYDADIKNRGLKLTPRQQRRVRKNIRQEQKALRGGA